MGKGLGVRRLALGEPSADSELGRPLSTSESPSLQRMETNQRNQFRAGVMVTLGKLRGKVTAAEGQKEPEEAGDGGQDSA